MKKIKQIEEEAYRIEEGRLAQLAGGAVLAGAMVSHGGAAKASSGYQDVMNDRGQAASTLDSAQKMGSMTGDAKRQALEFDRKYNYGKPANKRRPNPFVK